MVEGSRERETRALMVAVLGMILKVHDYTPQGGKSISIYIHTFMVKK